MRLVGVRGRPRAGRSHGGVPLLRGRGRGRARADRVDRALVADQRRRAFPLRRRGSTPAGRSRTGTRAGARSRCSRSSGRSRCWGRCTCRPVEVTWLGVAGAVALGSISASVLVANNLRDLPTDRAAGKLTLAVRLGDRGTRVLYFVLVAVPFVVTVVTAVSYPWLLLGLLAAVLVVPATRTVARRARRAGADPRAARHLAGDARVGTADRRGAGSRLTVRKGWGRRRAVSRR